MKQIKDLLRVFDQTEKLLNGPKIMEKTTMITILCTILGFMTLVTVIVVVRFCLCFEKNKLSNNKRRRFELAKHDHQPKKKVPKVRFDLPDIDKITV